MNPKLAKGVFLQFSSIVGAGIFTLPYLFYHSNYFYSVLFLFFVAIITIILKVFYIDVVLHTKGDHQLSGYAEIHLGRFFKTLSSIGLLLIALGGLLAYLKLASIFLNSLFTFLTPITGVIIFLSILSTFNFLHIKPSDKLSEIIPLTTLALIVVIFIVSFKFPSPVTVVSALPATSMLGVLIFSLSGFTIIPEIEELFRTTPGKKRLVYQSSIIGALLAVLIYILFTYAIIRINHGSLSADTITGLITSYPLLSKILAVLGLTIVFKASLNMTLIIKELFYRDFKIPQERAYFYANLMPFSVFLFLAIPVVSIISITGTVSIALTAILICLMRLRIKHNLSIDILSFVIIMVFVLGLITLK